jgi:hypothetical protein
VLGKLWNIIEYELVWVAEDILRCFVVVGEDLAHNLNALLKVIELRVTTELVSDFRVLIFFCHNSALFKFI